MKVYVIKEEDLVQLRLCFEGHPISRSKADAKETNAHEESRRFYDFRVQNWINQISREK